jgi:CheY-like chemotaxis protein
MKTILLTDDNQHIREYCRLALEEDGYRVVLAADGQEALRVFRDETPDLVILDICMPHVNGLEALERLKTIAPEVPVILFTAHDDDCLRDHRGDLATACVDKDADLSELKRAIERLFRPSLDGHDPPWRFGLPPLANVVSTLGTAPVLGGKL